MCQDLTPHNQLTLPDVLAQCRMLLENVTPLMQDCGMVCGGACCRSLPGEETGMLLFPGEDAWYVNRSDFALRRTSDGHTVLTCGGHCRREERPLSCRLFPLLPVLRADGVKVAVDARSASVCPLWRMGRRSMQPAFVDAVRACGQLLAEDETQRAFLAYLTRIHDELRVLQQSFRP